MTLLITAAAAGFLLGLYYNFLVLIPITLAAAMACCASAVFADANGISALWPIIVPAVALQAGYMVGLTSRDIAIWLASFARHLIAHRG